jgi:hypothetical protein
MNTRLRPHPWPCLHYNVTLDGTKSALARSVSRENPGADLPLTLCRKAHEMRSLAAHQLFRSFAISAPFCHVPSAVLRLTANPDSHPFDTRVTPFARKLPIKSHIVRCCENVRVGFRPAIVAVKCSAAAALNGRSRIPGAWAVFEKPAVDVLCTRRLHRSFDAVQHGIPQLRFH